MDASVKAYIEAIAPANRPLFDRLHALVLDVRPDAELVISYQIPTYKVGTRRLYIAAWKHGVSIYGWGEDRDGGFTARHPELSTGRGTLKLPLEDAAAIPDDEFRDLVRATLNS